MISFLSPRGRSPLPRPRGGLNPRCGVALCWSLLALLLLAHLLLRSRSGGPLDTRGWKLTDFVEHLQKRGVRLHAVPGTRHGGPCGYVYLTEDPDAGWDSLAGKMRIVERIHEWQGTVWVGGPGWYVDVEEEVARWGPHGCRIGDFFLFGDERLLRRIQEACRGRVGR